MTALPEISVIIPAHNEQDFLPGLLDSLQEHLENKVEVVVVDCGSMDNTAYVASRYPCKIIKRDKKENPSTTRNIGVEAARGQILVFLDADVVITAAWGARLTQLVRVEGVENELFITGDQYHISKKPSWLEHYWFEPLRKGHKDYINGGNLVTTRLLFDKIGGFETRLETGEDVDFCRRAVTIGAKLIFDPQLIVLHEGFPKSILSFMRRERWHGKGDFQQLRSIMRSKVALVTILFMIAHTLGAVSFLFPSTYSFSLLQFSIMVIFLVSLASAVYRFRRSGIYMILIGTAISYIYFLGRSLALVDVCKEKISNFIY